MIHFLQKQILHTYSPQAKNEITKKQLQKLNQSTTEKIKSRIIPAYKIGPKEIPQNKDDDLQKINKSKKAKFKGQNRPKMDPTSSLTYIFSDSLTSNIELQTSFQHLQN